MNKIEKNINFLNSFNTDQDLYNLTFIDMLGKAEKEKWIDESIVYNSAYQKKINDLNNIDLGGFEHGDLSSLYVYFQNNAQYEATRYFGWNSLFKIISKKANLSSSSDRLIVDFLAGSGTLDQRIKKLWPINRPRVIGIDVSKRMSQFAHEKNTLVFWGSHDTHPVKKKCG